jgi:DNA-binding CsgD family transcriptional regulator/tetratricopeptide (TPR) repeat protein
MITRAAVSPELVARQAELQTLIDLRRAAAQGRGALLLVGGDAGIGKTRLVAVFRETLTNGRAAVGTGLCREFGSVPYGPIREALQAVGAAAPLSVARNRAEQLAALHESLAAACSRRNVVLVLEDLHWADDGSLRFLSYVLPSIASLRLLVVGTYRTDEVQGASAVAPYLARFGRDRGCHQLVLPPLERAHIRQLIALALADRTRLAASEIDVIVERSDGNPFFAEELLKSALERRDRHGTARGLPLTIRAAVTERLTGLDEGARRILALAAVMGRRFDADFLTELAGCPVSEVWDTLRRVRDLQLVDEVRGAAPGYAFRHALTREAIYDEMLSAEVRPLHAHILRTLESRGEGSAHDLGYHAWSALDPARCVRYNERAGDEADALHAYADAVRGYERAMQGAQDDDAMGRLLAKAAASSARDGSAHRAAELYEAAAQAHERSGRIDRVAECYQSMSAQARLGGDNERAMAILQRALRTLPPDDAAARARLGLTLAFLYLDRGDAAAAAEMMATCAAAADTPGYHNTGSYFAMVTGDLGLLRSASSRYVEASAALGSDRVCSAKFNVGFGLCTLGIDDEALDRLEELLPELHERRLSSLEVLACANAALILGRRGRLAEARAMVERGLAIPEPATTGPIALASAALEIGCALGDEALVARSVTPAIIESAFASRINSTLGRFAGPYARWLRATGANREVANALRRAVTVLVSPFAAMETLLAAVELGDAWTRRRALEFLPAIEAMSGLELYAAGGTHLRAVEMCAAGEGMSSPATAREAARRYRALGWALHEARCLELAGDVADAAELYRGAGAVADVRRLEPTDVPGSTASVLSPREREISALIAKGIPNKHLAERFGVNQRTIEKHLTSIYGKLGLRSRSELAAFVARGER